MSEEMFEVPGWRLRELSGALARVRALTVTDAGRPIHPTKRVSVGEILAALGGGQTREEDK